MMAMLGGMKNSPRLDMSRSERPLIWWSFTHLSRRKRVSSSIPMMLEGSGMGVRATANSPRARQPNTKAR